MSEDIPITACEDGINTLTFTVKATGMYLPTSAKDVPCLVGSPNHWWHEFGIYMKCSKCGMSYEVPASKDFLL